MAIIKATAEQLIKITRDRAGVTDSDQDGTTDDDILDFINGEMFDNVIPGIMATNEKDYATTEVIPFVANKSRYHIPNRCMFDRVFDVKRQTADGQIYPLKLTMSQELDDIDVDDTDESPWGIYFEGRYMVTVPAIGSELDGGLRVTYCFRPGELTYASGCAQVQTVDLTTNTVVLNRAMPTDWSTANKFDIHSDFGGHDMKAWNLTATVAAGSTLTFSQKIDGTAMGNPVEVGDWVCLEGEAALTGLPQDMNIALVQAAVATISESAGDFDKRDRHLQNYERRMQRSGVILENQVRGVPYRSSLKRGIWTS